MEPSNRPKPGAIFILVDHPCNKPLRALGLDDEALRARADRSEALEMLIDGAWHRISWSSLEAAAEFRLFSWQLLPDDLREAVDSPLGGDWYTSRGRMDIVRGPSA